VLQLFVVRSAMLEAQQQWLNRHGLMSLLVALCAPVPGAKCDVLQVLARLVSERDKDIRQAALGALEVVYGFEAEGRQT
jgi:hypothetical protein